jgi:transposase
MDQRLRSSQLVPKGFVVDQMTRSVGRVRISVRSAQPTGLCPSCGTISRRVHSRYLRRPSDLPLAGHQVSLHLTVRGSAVMPSRAASRSSRNASLRMFLAAARGAPVGWSTSSTIWWLALGGRPAASFAQRLMLPVGNDTLLRVVRRRAQVPCEPLSVVGIDDFAWRRNHRYGTIVVDLERRRPVTLLPDRETATSRAWLADHPSITVVARDRGGGYGEAITKALPHATQVADRWHLMENASRAFLDAVRKSMRQIHSVIGATIINPALLTSAERLQYEGFLRREETNGSILSLEARRASQADCQTHRP